VLLGFGVIYLFWCVGSLACFEGESKSELWESLLVDRVEGSDFDFLGLVRVADGPNGPIRITEADESQEFRVTYQGAVIYEIESNSDRYPSACWATIEHLYCLMVDVDQGSDNEITTRYVVESVDALGHLSRCDDISSYQDPAGILHFQRIDPSGGFVFMFADGDSVDEGVIDTHCPP